MAWEWGLGVGWVTWVGQRKGFSWVDFGGGGGRRNQLSDVGVWERVGLGDLRVGGGRDQPSDLRVGRRLWLGDLASSLCAS